MKTSNPSLLVEKLRSAGFTLTAEGSRLRVAPADLLTDELRRSIKEHRAGLISILAAESAPAVECTTDATSAEKMQHRPDMAPSRVSCGTCLHFLPGHPMPGQSLGTCSLTGAGPPSVASGDYAACFPMAPRKCPSYELRDGL
ncbi:hypothetical protein [Acidithiobacillus ferriphilus]|uniref:TubC N-terminal docking domain-related protein n=1 Tax=Acidithiobacillus ferriphilus TaxID=1689834 RepID=UPI003B8A82B8|nr:hypothetical protein K1Y48_03765 [Acidithiobacillus ferriphilus]